MAALTPLSKMKPEQLANISPRELMRYNNPLPEYDPDAPTSQYPRYMFKAQVTDEGRAKLRTVLVPDEVEYNRKKKEGWVDKPLDCDPPIMTHPAAPEMPETEEEIEYETVAKKGKSAAAGA